MINYIIYAIGIIELIVYYNNATFHGMVMWCFGFLCMVIGSYLLGKSRVK